MFRKIAICVILRELCVLVSVLCVKPVLTSIQPNFNAEFTERDAEIAEKKLIVRINGGVYCVIWVKPTIITEPGHKVNEMISGI